MSGDEAKPVTPADLWRAADRITQPTRVRLPRDFDLAPEWVMLPSLWEQLVEAIDSLSGSGGKGAERSRPPCDTSALSLTLEIATAVRDTCLDARIKRTRDVPKDLRAVVSHVIRTGDPDALAKSVALLRGWGARIKVTISNDPDRTWRMHGARCRVCSSVSVPVFEPDGTETRQPALIVHSADGVIDKIECGFCGSVLTGPDLTQILYDTLKRSATEEAAPA